jgi:hypothetical protein
MIGCLWKRALPLFLAAVLLFSVFSGCGNFGSGSGDKNGQVFRCFTEIPGVGEADIAAVEELRGRVDHFVYAVNYSTEAFYTRICRAFLRMAD